MLADAELPFEPEFIDDLATKGLHTLFDVVTRRHEQLVVELGLEELRQEDFSMFAMHVAMHGKKRTAALFTFADSYSVTFNAGGVRPPAFFSSNEEGI